ncbi:MAG: phosphoribosyl-AMP cyclohydrolase [Candidatus Carsonella ruddii]
MNNFFYKILFLINWKKKIFPIIVKSFLNKKILTLTWLNKFSLIESFWYKKTCYWSRKKHYFWRKGFLSNNIQIIIKIKFDCDLDSFIYLINYLNKNCHYNLLKCFNYYL